MSEYTDYNGQVSANGYDVTVVSATLAGRYFTLTVTVDHSFDIPDTEQRRMEDLRVGIDGVLIGATYGPPPPGQVSMGLTFTGRQTRWVYQLDRTLLNVPPGSRKVVVSLWPKSSPTTSPVPYLGFDVTFPDLPAPVVAGRPIVLNVFWTDPAEFQNDPLLLGRFKDAGLNCVTTGVFMNPGDTGALTYDDWKAEWDSKVLAQLQWIKDNGLLLLGAGDDFLRFTAERNWIADSPWAQQAVQYVASKLTLLGNVVNVAVVDEIGGSPDQHPAFGLFKTWWRGAGGPPLSWPAPGGGSPPFPFEVDWDGSDVADRYWTDTEGRPLLQQTLSLWQCHNGVVRASAQIPVGRPWLCLVSAMGVFYTKGVAGGEYNPVGDVLEKGALRPSDIIAQIWLAFGYGAAGVRVYAFDQGALRVRRQSALVGTIDLQTGVKPGDDRWERGVKPACKSISARQAAILSGHFYDPVHAGGFVCCRRGSLSWAVNVTESDLECSGPGVLVSGDGETSFAGGPVPSGGVVIGNTPVARLLLAWGRKSMGPLVWSRESKGPVTWSRE